MLATSWSRGPSGSANSSKPRRPDRDRPTVFALRASGVDIIHAASMLGLAAIDVRHRRPALADAVVASGFAAAGYAVTRRRRIDADVT